MTLMTFLGNIAFVHVDGGNDASFYPVTHLTTFKACTRITSVFCSLLVPWDDSMQEEQTPDEWQKSKTRALEDSPAWQWLGSQAHKAREIRDMSQYLLHILCLSSSIRAGRYFYYILN